MTPNYEDLLKAILHLATIACFRQREERAPVDNCCEATQLEIDRLQKYSVDRIKELLKEV